MIQDMTVVNTKRSYACFNSNPFPSSIKNNKRETATATTRHSLLFPQHNISVLCFTLYLSLSVSANNTTINVRCINHEIHVQASIAQISNSPSTLSCCSFIKLYCSSNATRFILLLQALISFFSFLFIFVFLKQVP